MRVFCHFLQICSPFVALSLCLVRQYGLCVRPRSWQEVVRPSRKWGHLFTLMRQRINMTNILTQTINIPLNHQFERMYHQQLNHFMEPRTYCVAVAFSRWSLNHLEKISVQLLCDQLKMDICCSTIVKDIRHLCVPVLACAFFHCRLVSWYSPPCRGLSVAFPVCSCGMYHVYYYVLYNM